MSWSLQFVLASYSPCWELWHVLGTSARILSFATCREFFCPCWELWHVLGTSARAGSFGTCYDIVTCWELYHMLGHLTPAWLLGICMKCAIETLPLGLSCTRPLLRVPQPHKVQLALRPLSKPARRLPRPQARARTASISYCAASSPSLGFRRLQPLETGRPGAGGANQQA